MLNPLFAVLRAPSCPASVLTPVAQDFTPRFEVVGSLVVLDVSGLARLFGGPHEIGDHLLRAAAARAPEARVAVAPTAAAAMLLVLGQPGLSVIASGGEMAHRLAALPVSVLGAYERVRREQLVPDPPRPGRDGANRQAPGTAAGEAEAVMAAAAPVAADREVKRGEGGWQHPRQTHQAGHTRLGARGRGGPSSADAIRARREAIDVQATLDLLVRWGVDTLGALSVLPMPAVAERLGARGTRWQRLARGEDERPLVPWVPEEPFEASLDLEWPIEGLEPLSFVLTRLLEPLSERLARADRGAALVHTRLGLVDKTTCVRQLQLPAPMRDSKTLRTLMLLDLESHPPSAAIDRVGVLIEPTPGRVLQWTLFERAQPSPEQVSTLLARLTALMGEGHVGSPALVDSWQPGAFDMQPFRVDEAGGGASARATAESPLTPAASAAVVTPPVPGEPAADAAHRLPTTVLRRFRLPVPARVRVHEGRPVRVQVDRRGLSSGAIVEAAGPWRTSGAWWEAAGGVGTRTPADAPDACPSVRTAAPWDRDEWDVSLADGTIYRVYVERAVGQWFIEGVID